MSSVRILIAIITLLITFFYSSKLGLLMIFLTIMEFLYYSGVFIKTKFNKWRLNDSDIFYLEHKGEYKNVGNSIKNLENIANKYHLDRRNWSTFGFYYDNPQVTKPENCRAVIGLIYTYENAFPENKQLNNEIFNFLIQEGLEYNRIAEVDCLMAKYPYVNFISFFSSVIKFNKNLISGLKDNEFLRKYSIKVEFKYAIEIYKEKELIFAMPLEKVEQFFLFTGQSEYVKKSYNKLNCKKIN